MRPGNETAIDQRLKYAGADRRSAASKPCAIARWSCTGATGALARNSVWAAKSTRGLTRLEKPRGRPRHAYMGRASPLYSMHRTGGIGQNMSEGRIQRSWSHGVLCQPFNSA
jgi:hypothetical protein